MANNIFTTFFGWLKSTEMFASPSKQIPGRWELIEYYIESGKELRNIKKTQLKAGNEFWHIEFTAEHQFLHETNLPVWQINKVTNGDWNVSKNFITLSSADNTRNNIEFQFAVENRTLKLLKKDALGRIEFFGFFSKEV
jgi:hypothetical protein